MGREETMTLLCFPDRSRELGNGKGCQSRPGGRAGGQGQRKLELY